MTLELITLLTQTVAVFFLTAWLTTGVYENLFFPDLNSTFTAEVLDMTSMREDYPDAYARVSYRRVTNPKIQKFLFRCIVTWELIATIGLWVGFGAMLTALFGATPVETALSFALLGVLLFTSTWAGFLVAGNWFCYWFCHEGAQNTHYQMTLWGIGTAILMLL